MNPHHSMKFHYGCMERLWRNHCKFYCFVLFCKKRKNRYFESNRIKGWDGRLVEYFLTSTLTYIFFLFLKVVTIIGVIQNFRINGVDRERRDMLSNLVETNVYWIHQKLGVKITIKTVENGPNGIQRNAKQMLLICMLPVQGVVMYVLYLRLIVVVMVAVMSCKLYKVIEKI